jgi:hypothetical protein
LSLFGFTVARLDVDLPPVNPAAPVTHNGAHHPFSDRVLKHVLHLN